MYYITKFRFSSSSCLGCVLDEMSFPGLASKYPVDEKSFGPNVDWTKCPVDEKSVGPKVDWTKCGVGLIIVSFSKPSKFQTVSRFNFSSLGVTSIPCVI